MARVKRQKQRASNHRVMSVQEAWQRACALSRGVRDPSYRDLVQRVDGGMLHSCPPSVVLPDGREAFEAVGAALAEAQEEILVETYILRDDRIGDALRHALADAIKRGVRVCVLADAVGSMATGRQYWRKLEGSGVTVRLFHPWWKAPQYAWRRDHRKIIVVDRRIAFTGGMNIGVEYGSSIRKHDHAAWRDTFIRLEGPVAVELAAVFAEGWDRAGGPPLPGLEYVSWSEGIVVPPHGLARWNAAALGAA